MGHVNIALDELERMHREVDAELAPALRRALIAEDRLAIDGLRQVRESQDEIARQIAALRAKEAKGPQWPE